MSSKEVQSKSQLRPFTFDEAQIVRNDDTYMIQDLNLYDRLGRIVFTISITILHVGKQTRGHTHPHDSEVYEFSEGTGWMLIGTEGINVKAGDCVLVEAGQFHKVINTSNASDLAFRCYFAGQIKRPHLAVK